MFRAYIAAAFAAFGLYSAGQYKGWSLMPSEAQEFQRSRAEQASSYGRGSSGSGSRSSGHK